MTDNVSYALLHGVGNVAIAFAVGYVLYKLIKTKSSPTKASDYGRNWMAWMVLIATMAGLPKVIIDPNPGTIFKFIAPIIIFTLIAFILGFVYGKFKVRKDSSISVADNPNTTSNNQTISSGVKCGNCGAEIVPKDAKFCKHCGTKVEQVITTSTTVKAEAIKPPTIEKKIVDEVKIDKPDDVATQHETNKEIEKPLVHKDIKSSSKNNQARNTLILLSIFVIILIVVFSNTKKSIGVPSFGPTGGTVPSAFIAPTDNDQPLRIPDLEYKNGKTKEYYERNGYTWVELDYYVGWSKNNKFNGYGLVTSRNSTYEGEILNDNKHGQGVTTWRSGKSKGDRYEGQYKYNKMNGKGIYTWANGDRYEGEYKDDKKSKGIMTWAIGDRYEGQYKDGKRHGQGVYIKTDGERYEGTWKHGEL